MKFWNQYKREIRLFLSILLLEVIIEMIGYQYLGRHIFGEVWESDATLEPFVHLIWLVIVTTPLLFALINRMIKQEKEHSKAIWNLAHYDELTGVRNRRHLMLILQGVLDSSRNVDGRFAVLFIDLDRFKNINDSLGHDMGDEVLKRLSQMITESLPEDSVLARFGGDEFVVVMPKIGDTNDAMEVADRILHRVQEPVVVEGFEFLLTTSIGIAVFPTSGDSVTSILKSADAAMYEAKRLGKNRFYVHLPSIQNHLYSRYTLERDLRRAIHNKQELYMVFQPQVDVQSGWVAGTEALVRWNHPSLGDIPPTEFIPIVEEMGLMIDLGRFVLQMVCEQVRNWMLSGKRVLPVGINISQIELSEPDFAEHFFETLVQYDIPSSYICVEITETALMKDAVRARTILNKLREYGIRVLVDDFGQGYNSLALLRQIPVDVMKIDRTFVRDIHASAVELSVFSTLVSLAHSNEIEVIAEGVERDEQLSLVRSEGCDEYQGYLFSPPVLASVFAQKYL